MTKAKRKKLSPPEPMEIDEPVENGKDHVESEEEEDYDHISDDEEGGMRIGDIYIPPAPKPALTFDPTGPRMIITHIENENFKSYAGKQYLGPFHKSFTAIIGPNGSGKSNVIDSMLFVFGYRASKIRSKKISVLIHSSSKYPNVQSATVSVHFCQIIDGPALEPNEDKTSPSLEPSEETEVVSLTKKDDDKYTVVPDSEIVVSRTAFKDNSSHYTLNGRRVQFKEVARLLKNYGIDLDHNRFLILQGEVEQIAMMKPKALTEHEFGMLEYLEDIIGTSRYKKPIEKLSDRVEELTESRKEKLNRVRLVEAEKQKLEQPMREAVELMNLTNQCLRTRNMLLQKYMFETKKMVDAKMNDRSVLEVQLSEIDERLNVINNEVEEKTAVLREGTKKYDVLQKQKESVTEKLQLSKKKMVSVMADTTQSNKKKKNLDQLLDQEKGKLLDLELVPEKNTREIEDCEKLLTKHNENKRKAEDELQTVVAGVRERTEGLQANKDRLQAKLIGLKKIVDEANKTFKLAESELKIYLSTEQNETKKLDTLKQSYEKASADLKEKKRMQKELQRTLPENEREMSQLQSQLENYKQEESNVLNETRSLRSQLEESRQALSANRSKGRVLDSLMKEKKNGNLPGIFGRMGDLGGIDLKYDVAISTCCGALDNIVVDTVETAQACVEYLKRNDIGRATFIALDKQTHLKQHYERRQSFPENVPRLFDLIKVKDERVKPAFYYALRDTLVATDLEQASRIAYGATRYRVVSLKGDVIEIAGTMSGGGKSISRGRMGSSVQQDTSEQDPAALQANERKLASLEQRLSELRSQQSSIEDSVINLQRTVREGKMTREKLNVELRSLSEQVPLMQNQIKQQEAKVSSSRVDEERKAELEAVVEEAAESLDRANHDAGEVEKEVHGVDAQISAIAGGRVKDMQKKVDELTSKISKVTTEITKLRVGINTSVRNAKKSKDKIAQMEADLSETERNLENLAAQKRQLTLDSAQFAKELEEVEEQINEGTDEFSGLKKEIAKLQSRENKIKSERLECQNNLNKLDKSIADCKNKSPVWEKELSQLKLEECGVETVPGLDRPEPLATHTDGELDAVTVEELRNRHHMQRQRVGDNKPDLQAVRDFQTKEALYLKRAQELEEITTKRNEMRSLYDQLRKKRQTDFLCGFNTITTKLKEMYQMITLGGDAELELVDSLDPFTEGIIFSVRPPNKSWKNISNLSGGEKTLSSLALVFALHYYKPTPLYVMDEIDAALDFKNVSIVANYIKERTKNAQFIIISLRYIMFEASNRLVGIYKTQDCTKCVTIDNRLPPDELEALL